MNIQLVIKFLFMNFYYQIEKFVISVSRTYDKKGKKLLDIGAQSSPYKKYFRLLNYYSQDLKQNRKKTIDYVGDLNIGLPQIKNNSFDYILCTQVLEHIQKPNVAFKEFNRILKKGGRLFLTTNFFYQIHMAPNDYYRFTKYGLRYLGRSYGFRVKHLQPHGGIFQTISYLISTTPIRLFLKRHKKLYYGYLLFFSLPIILLNLIAVMLDNLDKDKEVAINYEVIYEKV